MALKKNDKNEVAVQNFWIVQNDNEIANLGKRPNTAANNVQIGAKV